MRKNPNLFICPMAVLLGFLLFSTNSSAQDPLHNNLFSAGDSITLAINAEHLLQNNHASWVHGKYGFWQWLFGLTYVDSHYMRIIARYGIRNSS